MTEMRSLYTMIDALPESGKHEYWTHYRWLHGTTPRKKHTVECQLEITNAAYEYARRYEP